MKLKLFIWIICLGLTSSCSQMPESVNVSQSSPQPEPAAATPHSIASQESPPVVDESLSAEQEKTASKAPQSSPQPASADAEPQPIAFPPPPVVEQTVQLVDSSQSGTDESLSAEQKEQLKLAKDYNDQVEQYYQLGLFKEALPLAEKAFQIRKDIFGERHPDTLLSMKHLAKIYNDLELLEEALPLYEKGYHIRKILLGDKHPNTLLNMNELAMIYQDLGHLSEALPLLEKGYPLSKEVLGEKHILTILILSNLSVISQGLGLLSEALPLAEKSYRLSKEVLGEKHPLTLSCLNNLAMNYKKLDRLSEALPLLESGYSLTNEVLGEKHPDTLSSRNNLAAIYLKLGRLSEALPLLETGYPLNKEVLGEKHPLTLSCLNNLALIYQYLGKLSEALPLLEKGYRLRQEILGEKHPDTLTSLSNLAFAYVKQGNINQAIQYLETFVAGVESLRSGELSAENRQSWFKQRVQGYFWLSFLYGTQSRPQDAFRLAEMSKARSVLESLAAKVAAQQSGLSTAEQEQLQAYEARLVSLNNRIAKALDDKRFEDRVKLEKYKNQLFNELRELNEILKAKYPKYARLSEIQFISANEGVTLVPAEAVFISYLTFGNKVLAFTLQANGQLTAHDLGEIPGIETDLKSYRRQMEEGTVSTLGKRLLEPLKDIIKDKPQWIISPSGPLTFLPFETLRFEGEDQAVIAQHQISYVQSLSVLAMLQKRDKAYKSLKKRETLFAMGAPIYESVAAEQKPPTQADDLKWKNLPGTELEELGNLFKNSQIYKKAEATESKLQSLNQQGVLANYRYIVFSAHGYLSPQVPELSSIVLGQVNNPAGIDGYVTAGEWPGYNLKSDLMVLLGVKRSNGAELRSTGLGEVVSGEGVMGLPYALYVAGNKNTILTLWSISDEVTTAFVTSFFAKLKAGVGQVEALTATKREFLNKGGKYANPVYWAAFVLYGV